MSRSSSECFNLCSNLLESLFNLEQVSQASEKSSGETLKGVFVAKAVGMMALMMEEMAG